MSDDLLLFDHPSLPDQWGYEASVKRMRSLIYKWKNMTRDVANELWIARESLKNKFEAYQKGEGDANAPPPTWSSYCDEIGINKSTANRWLTKWFPESLTLENKPVVTLQGWADWLVDKECDLLFTDPPYMTDIDGDIFSFARQWLPPAIQAVRSTGRAYVCVGAYPEELSAYIQASENLPIKLRNILVWAYQNTLGPSPSHDYKLNWQAILYFCGPDAPPLKCTSMVEQFTVQNISAPDGRQGDRYHEWQKPLELAERIIKHSTEMGQTIIDPFVGTGTFVLAANKLGRIGLGCDIDETALDIACKRGCKRE